MSAATLGFAALFVYVGVLLLVGDRARRARLDATPADHYLAGRGLGLWVLFLTLYATAYSGNSLLGYPGEAYRRGFAWVHSIGFMMSILVAYHALVPVLRPLAIRFDFVSPGDWIRHRFGDESGGVALVRSVGVLMAVASLNFLLAQLMAMGHVIGEITDGVVPYTVAVIGCAVAILAYETVGGMRAVAWTDAIQGSLMLVGLLALLGWILDEAGGLAAISRAVAVARPTALEVPGPRECANWISTLLLMGVASIIYPQALQRVFAARSGRSLRHALALMSFMPLATTLVVFLAGVSAIPRYEGLGAIEADTVMPRLLAEWAATGALGTVLVLGVLIAALAAIMSTADSVLLALGSIVAADVLGRKAADAATTRLGKWVSAGSMAACLVLALDPRFTLWRLIELKMELLIQCAPAFLVALHWRDLRAQATLAGLFVGTVLVIAAALFEIKRMGGIHVGVLAFGVNLAVAVFVSLAMGSRSVRRTG